MIRSTLSGVLSVLLIATAAGCAPPPVQPPASPEEPTTSPEMVQPTAPPQPGPGRALPKLDPERWPFADGQPYLQPDGTGWGFLPHVRFAVFQAPGGGEYDLMMSCSDRNLSLNYFPPEDVTRERETFTVASGSVRTTLRAQYTPSTTAPPPAARGRAVEGEDDPSFDASALVSDPFFQAFLRTGRLSVSNSDRTLVADVQPGELEWLRRFFQPCLSQATPAAD